jgi:hypothetical protein
VVAAPDFEVNRIQRALLTTLSISPLFVAVVAVVVVVVVSQKIGRYECRYVFYVSLFPGSVNRSSQRCRVGCSWESIDI